MGFGENTEGTCLWNGKWRFLGDRGSCDSGLLAHTYIRVHAGPLSNLVMVGFLKKKTFPLAVARTKEQFSAPPPNPLLPISLVPIPQGQGRNTVSRRRALGISLPEVVSSSLERRAIL